MLYLLPILRKYSGQPNKQRDRQTDIPDKKSIVHGARDYNQSTFIHS